MEVRRLILLLFGGLLVLSGCRTGQQVRLLEQELRLQEDRIYQLQDCLQETQMALDACSQENESLRRGTGEGQGGSVGPASSGPSSGGRAAESEPTSGELKVEIPSAGGASSALPEMLRGGKRSGGATDSLPLDMQLKVSPGVETPPSTPSPPSESQPEQVPTPTASDSLEPPSRQEGPSIEALGASDLAARIDVGDLAVERIPGGASGAGEEAFSLLIVARDGHGASLPAASPISIVVVDPAVSGPAGRLARWDFTAEQVAGVRESSESGDGFRLRLRWPGGQGPAHKELHLFVRYETADGRKLNAETPFDLGRVAAAEPVVALRSAAGWQRKTMAASKERTSAESSAVAAGGSASSYGSTAWRGAAGGGPSSEAPAWNGPPAETGHRGELRSRPPERVARRLQAPEWSPERR